MRSRYFFTFTSGLIAGLEVVGAVDDHVEVLQDLEDVVRGHALAILLDLHVGVEADDGLLGAVDLGHAHALGRVQDLALQVRRIDHVVIDDADRADAGRGQVQRRRRAQATGADAQHPGLEQLDLALDPDLGQHGVPRVAELLVLGHHHRDVEGIAVALPRREAAGHRLHLGVAELAQRACGQGRARAARAVQDHRLVAIGYGLFDAQLQIPARDPRGPRDVPLHVLILLAHVDDGLAATPLILEKLDATGVYLFDFTLDSLEIILEGGHRVSLPDHAGYAEPCRSPVGCSDGNYP
jgi:hypothetical protein